MEATPNEELWRVQLRTGEIRLMTLDALDRAFDEGVIDARVPVLPPGASSWTTLGEAAGLEPEPSQQHDMPSLSPMAISQSSSPPALDLRSESPLDLELPETFDELKPRRRGLLFGGLAAAGAAAVMVAVVLARISSGLPATAEIKATSAVQAPPAAVETLPTKEADAPKPADNKPELSDWQKRMLLDGDKAREEKVRAKNQGKADKNVRSAPRKQQPKASGGLLNGGDRFDPLNGAL